MYPSKKQEIIANCATMAETVGMNFDAKTYQISYKDGTVALAFDPIPGYDEVEQDNLYDTYEQGIENLHYACEWLNARHWLEQYSRNS